jgi:hypothetical protein
MTSDGAMGSTLQRAGAGIDAGVADMAMVRNRHRNGVDGSARRWDTLPTLRRIPIGILSC